MHSPRRLLRRIGAALSSILLLQLTLLGSGTLCAMPSGAAAPMHDMGGMAGMTHSLAKGQQTPPASSHPDEGCRLPWSPGQCATMTACTIAAMPAATVVVALDARPAAAELPLPAHLGSRPATPPELPPPRA